MYRKYATILAGAASLAVVTLAIPSAAAKSSPAGPAPLAPPTGHALVATYLVGSGSQTYECIVDPATSAGTWRGRPVAVLVAPQRRSVPVGTHDSVTNQGTAPTPQWSLISDGSRVVARVATGGSFPAPDPTKAIAALRLDVTQNSGIGKLADVDTIQRDLVRGGVGPSGACDPATAKPVISEYQARYTFWAKTS
jgi:hypothetical protein